MTALQIIIKEAKAIRKKSPKIEWKKAVAQASAIYASKHKGKSPVVKKVAKKAPKKKAVGKVDKKLAKGLASRGLKMPHGYDVVKRKRKVSGIKKSAVKRKPTEKTVLKSIKHAVNVQKKHMSGIRIMSGTVKPKPTVVAVSKKIAKLTDYNNHNGAILTLAKFLKDKKAIELMNYVIKMHNVYGHMPKQLDDIRLDVLDKLFITLKHKYGEIDYRLIKDAF